MFRAAAAVAAVRIAILILASFALVGGTVGDGYSLAPRPQRGSKMVKRSAYEVIIKKNLFDHTRQESPDESAQPLDTSSQNGRMKHLSRLANAGGMVLEGIIIFGDHRVAVVREGGRSKRGVKEVRAGDSLGSYKIISIEDEVLVLRGSGGSEHVLTLFELDTP